MNAPDILRQLEPLGTEAYRKILRTHGVPEPLYGVKIEALKKLQKRLGTDYHLALALYDTGIYDARYLAGLVADAARMTPADLQHWVETANCATLCEYTVPGVAAESRHGHDLGLAWIESSAEGIASAGWATLGGLMSIRDDADLDLAELERLLQRIQDRIHTQPNRVRYVMNGFVIAAGGFVPALTEPALRAAARIGPVTVDMGGTACKVPAAAQYIDKMRARGTIGKKRKTARC